MSDIDIINHGFVEIGEKTITSLTGGQTRQAIAAVKYPTTRKALLTELNWRFATHTQQLARLAETPANTDYLYAYALPSNPEFLKVQRLNPNGDYVIEGITLLSNETTLLMTYTADVDESVMPPYFTHLLGLRMGSEMAMPITRNVKKRKAAEENYDKYLPIARHADSSQQPNRDVADQPFIDCRN